MSSNHSSLNGETPMPDMGYMKIHVHEANMSPDLLSHNEISQVEITVSNLSLSQKNNTQIMSVTRQTPHMAGSSPKWNDSIEIRCCLGWDISISVIVEDPKMARNRENVRDSNKFEIQQNHHIQQNIHNNNHNSNLLRVDNLVAGNCTSGQYYLRKDGKVCGDIYITLEFFPNHQSLKCLAEEVLGVGSSKTCDPSHGTDMEIVRDPSLLMLLLSELVGMIRHSAKSRNHLPPHSPVNHSSGGLGAGIAMGGGGGSIGVSGPGLHVDDFSLRSDDCTPQKKPQTDAQRHESKQAWKQLHSSAFILKDYLNAEVMQSFLVQHHFSSSARGPRSGSFGDQGDSSSSDSPPSSVETFRVAAAARSFLNTILLAPLLHPPQQNGVSNASIGSDNSFSHATTSSAQYLAPAATISLIEKQLFMFILTSTNFSKSSSGGGRASKIPPRMSWDDVILFIQLISVWYLQHAYVAKSLSDEYNIHPAELSGIRDRFEKYDENLSGDMPANMVAYLLQDMGEYYTPEEVQFLKSTELDADNLGVVEFPEVIRWWCSN